MLFQRTIYNICKVSKSSEELIEKLKEKKIPFELCGGCFVKNLDGEVIGRCLCNIDLGKIDSSYYAEEYNGYDIIEMDKPFKYFFYSKTET
ncbi:hypothetical protein SAMN04487760_1054 [Lachnospiraceae bacterium G41]|nr:hypothetical protein SAMN04487760_1054 [Lachnospiraceae bacterium G41]